MKNESRLIPFPATFLLLAVACLAAYGMLHRANFLLVGTVLLIVAVIPLPAVERIPWYLTLTAVAIGSALVHTILSSRTGAALLLFTAGALGSRGLLHGARREILARFEERFDTLRKEVRRLRALREKKENEWNEAQSFLDEIHTQFQAVRFIGTSLRFEETWNEISRGALRLFGSEPLLHLPRIAENIPEGYYPPRNLVSSSSLGRAPLFPDDLVGPEEGFADTTAAIYWEKASRGEPVRIRLGREHFAAWIPFTLGNGKRVVVHIVGRREEFLGQGGHKREENTFSETRLEHLKANALEIFVNQVGQSLEKLRLYELAVSQSRTDLMTGLPHHARFETILSEEMSRARDAGKPLSLLICDIDRFKRINDTYGHLAGDAVIVHIARLLRNRVRISDTVARYGGEEFVVILPGTPVSGANEIAERIREMIEATPAGVHGPTGEVSVPLTISIGGTELNDGDSLADLIERADQALYSAKRGGRNRVVIK
ncbi:MAG: GGDEF domain-containing protein [Candidatus Hydrogenedentota bacterium]|nr:MAG: GGDEF domain-containing protein [Candidatus Hydrogenedentota bacterium]